VNLGPHLFWITSRAAGGAALLTASAAVSLGLLMSMKLRIPGRRDLRPLHEALSLSTLALVLLHGFALLGDRWLNPGLTGIAIPFVGGYRPLWTGIGIVSAYGLAVLAGSYYLRDRIGAARWRRVHRLTSVFWLLAIVHTIGAGSDALQWWFLIAAGALVVPSAILLLVRWLPSEGGRPAVSRNSQVSPRIGA
jgi:sulfoxide reductase heme-binding subunit YedZ